MNQNLADELVMMMREDQRLLQQLFDSGELPAGSYHPRMKALHQQNTSRLKEIMRHHGWPGLSLVGKDGAKAAWLIAQHSVSEPEFMAECAGLLEEAVSKDDTEGWQLAFLQDRVRTLSGNPQYYGTQFDTDEQGWPTPFPIEEPATVNARRARLGMNTLEERQEQMIEQERKRRANAAKTR
ncbi:hypothetical protein B5T_04341 [Alloalcanivorax dieselolei B5]|uniref:Uncharacterized protein n=1 Tax=Alcanivorax dieselolei (strain DSM 16502 / CGMCC 1.3690 / MCCC 1A00001 / B-5) TaxID=930169 RepID=K0CLT3_ALCDB|nr:DUF6624 domain-containing protein [Alloalcanivorax dieselolei]AFT72601.1 hypothetical protein B5T_04341 [Alloalcanivorax dieselolei B5]GGJ79069.1 hypothetical protein GCM10007426_05250 [Alloalcanivorax dieselolei]